RHAERVERTADAAGRHALADNATDMHRTHLSPRASFLDRCQGSASCCAVPLKTLLSELQQERFRGGNSALAAIIPDRHHLPEYVIVRDVSTSVSRSTTRVAALPLAEPA